MPGWQHAKTLLVSEAVTFGPMFSPEINAAVKRIAADVPQERISRRHWATEAAQADLTGSIVASLRNHVGKGIERTNEGSPARWQLSQKE